MPMGTAVFERLVALPASDREHFLRRALQDRAARRQLAVSPAQRRLWLVHRLEPGSAAYNAPAAFRFRGAIDNAALRSALTDVCRRHEVLRFRFVEVDGEPVGLLAASGPELRTITLPVGTEREQSYDRIVSEEVRKPFDLAADSPVRALLITAAEDDHMFVLTAHHIVTDAHSLGIMLTELSERYEAHISGQTADLPEPDLQYTDYTAWLDDLARSGEQAVDLKFWIAALEGAPNELDIPLDNSRPVQQTLRGATATGSVPAPQVRRLLESVRKHGATPFLAFAAAWGVLLSQYSGQDDVLTGIPESGRRRPEFENTVGLFVNTVILRAELSGDPSFGQVLERLRTAMRDAREHTPLPLEALVRARGAAGVRDRNPLFQSFFAYHPDDRGGFRLGDVPSEPVSTTVGTAAFDLDLAVEALPDGSARLTLAYAVDIIAPATAERMLRHLGRIVRHMANDSAEPISATLVLDEVERAALASPARPRMPATADCLHDFVDHGIREHRSAVAVTSTGGHITFGELDARASQLAWRLRELGVRPDDPVALCLPRDHRLITVILGILRAGGGYVPLDPSIPAKRLRYQAIDSGAQILVTDDAGLRLLGGPPGTAITVVSLDDPDDGTALAAHPVTMPPPAAGPGDLAYVLYTSGSTGRPKGVAVEHGNAVGLMEFYRTVLRPDDLAGVLGSTPVGFDATILEYFATLHFGGTVHLVESIFDIARLPDPDAITLIESSPSLLARLLDHGPLPTALRLVLLSGERLPQTLVNRIQAARPAARIFDIYGVTECTADATWARRRPGGDPRTGLGEPLPGMRYYVLDLDGRPVPAGARGELHLAGPAVARGYVNDSELTSRRFIPDPFQPGERMYRTGDIVRLRPDGELEYHGRADRQVKVHGSRVEPGDVESALTAHPHVDAAAVVAQPTAEGDCRLVAYLAVSEGRLPPTDLRTHLLSRLPRHMVPATIVPLVALPLNHNGKLDIGALPPADTPPPGTGALTKPRTEAESLLTTIWSEVLERDVGVHDDFFVVGGNSLAALRLAARIRSVLGAQIPVDTLFQHPTIAELAAAISSGADIPTCPRVLRPHGSEPPLILVHSADGGVMPFGHLVRALGQDRPIYAFEPRGLYDDLPPLRSIPDMAEHYWKRLAELGVTGPVVLIGWSVGGAIAYEMGCQAADAAHRTVVLDTLLGREGHPKDAAEEAVAKSRYMLYSASSAAGEAYDEHRITIEGLNLALLADGRPPAEHLLEWARRAGLAGAGDTAADLARQARVLAANLHASDDFVPAPPANPVLFLASQDDGQGRVDPLVPIAGDRLTFRTVPGDHRTMLRPPHVAAVAAAITRWLDGESDPDGPAAAKLKNNTKGSC